MTEGKATERRACLKNRAGFHETSSGLITPQKTSHGASSTPHQNLSQVSTHPDVVELGGLKGGDGVVVPDADRGVNGKVRGDGDGPAGADGLRTVVAAARGFRTTRGIRGWALVRKSEQVCSQRVRRAVTAVAEPFSHTHKRTQKKISPAFPSPSVRGAAHWAGAVAVLPRVGARVRHLHGVAELVEVRVQEVDPAVQVCGFVCCLCVCLRGMQRCDADGGRGWRAPLPLQQPRKKTELHALAASPSFSPSRTAPQCAPVGSDPDVAELS